MIRRTLLAVVLAALGFVTSLPAQTPSDLLQKGIYTQDTVGDVDGALTIFRQVLTAPTSQRRYAAHAQARIVRCFIQKGDMASATEQFNLLARRYSDFKDI